MPKAKKRNRSSNWDSDEKHLLMEIVKPYIHIIENKDLKTNTNNAKLKAWKEILQGFNEINSRTRELEQLRSQWKTIKMSSKTEMSAFRKEVKKTGGGPPPPSPSPETKEIAELIPQEFEVDFNIFDSDGKKEEAIVPAVAAVAEVNEVNENSNNHDPPSFSFEEAMIPSPEEYISPKITTRTKQTESGPSETKKTKKAASIAPEKRKKNEKENFNFAEATFTDMHNFRAMENSRLEEEHKLKIANLKEIHSAMMLNLDLQYQILTATLKKT